MQLPKDVLEEALEITSKDRQNQYGPPERNLENIANLWQVYLSGRGILEDFINPEDVANMMALLKIARCISNINSGMPISRDNIVDIAGYARLAYLVSNYEDSSE